MPLFAKRAAKALLVTRKVITMGSNRIYLDYAASAPLRPEAYQAWVDYHMLSCSGANPNSLHTLGREASQHLENARRRISRVLDGAWRPSEIIFTSGGTESNNLALLGMAEGARTRNNKRTKVVLSAIEHDSVLDLATLLHSRGFETVLVKPNSNGFISPDALSDYLDSAVAVVSIMAANNETGVIQPTDDLARAAHSAGALFHSDAIQAFGHIPLELDSVDAVSVAGHKIGAPVGTGFIALRTRTPYVAQSLGGGQEGGKRAGTQDVAGALALAAAAEVACSDISATRSSIAAKANAVYTRLCTQDSGIIPTTTATVNDAKLPGIVSIMVPSLDSETLVLKLDDAGYEVSAGSACSSGSLDPSHVLSAMGIPRDNALGSLRISFDERVDQSDLDSFCDALLSIVKAG